MVGTVIRARSADLRSAHGSSALDPRVRHASEPWIYGRFARREDPCVRRVTGTQKYEVSMKFSKLRTFLFSATAVLPAVAGCSGQDAGDDVLESAEQAALGDQIPGISAPDF